MNWLGITVVIILIVIVLILIIVAFVSALRNEHKGDTGSTGTTGVTGDVLSPNVNPIYRGDTVAPPIFEPPKISEKKPLLENEYRMGVPPLILENYDSQKEEEIIYLSDVQNSEPRSSIESFKLDSYKCIDVIFHDYNYYLLSCGEKIILESNNNRKTITSSMKLKQLEMVNNRIYALTEKGNLVKLISTPETKTWLWEIIENKIIWLQFIENETFWFQKFDKTQNKEDKYIGYLYDLSKREYILIIPNLKYRRIYSDVGNAYIDLEPNLHIHYNLPDNIYDLTFHNGNPYFICNYEKDIYVKFIRKKVKLLKLAV